MTFLKEFKKLLKLIDGKFESTNDFLKIEMVRETIVGPLTMYEEQMLETIKHTRELQDDLVLCGALWSVLKHRLAISEKHSVVYKLLLEGGLDSERATELMAQIRINLDVDLELPELVPVLKKIITPSTLRITTADQLPLLIFGGLIVYRT